ncbi:MAG: hypothetical protein QOJ67_3226 [Acidimicrobiaceae bacterium]
MDHRSDSRGTWSRVGRSLVVAAIVATVAAIVAPPSRAETNAAYDAVASAYAFDGLVHNDSIPLGLSPEVAGPVAQVSQSSLPGSEAFASFPYPGDTAVGLLPTASSLYGVALPDYPLIARSSLGADQPTEVNAPGLDLTARTGATETEASGTAGSEAAGGHAHSQIVADNDGTVTATAESNVTLLEIGGLARLSGVRSTATTKLDPDGTITKSSSLSIGSIAVPGLELAIPANTPGFVPLPIPIPIPGVDAPSLQLPVIPIPLGGQTLDVPALGFTDGVFTMQLPLFPGQQFAVPAQTVLDALKALGLVFTYEAAHETDTSIVAPVLTLATTLPALPQNGYFNGPVDLQVALGRASAGITPYATGANTAPDAPSDSSAAPIVSSGLVPSSPVVAPSFGSPSGVAAAARPSTAGQRSNPVVAFGTPQYFNASWFYVMFVAVALAAFGGTTALRYLGVRATWI